MPGRLFIKLLLGFWLITVMIAGTILALPWMLQQQQELAIPHQVHKFHQRLADELAASQDPRRRLKMLKSRRDRGGHGHRDGVRHDKHKPLGRHSLYLLDANNFPVDGRKLHHAISAAIGDQQDDAKPRLRKYPPWLVFGPYAVNHPSGSYQLYIKHREPKGSRWWLYTLANNRGLTLLLTILISGLCCGLLAWHLTRPLKSLQQSANRLAGGDLQARAEKLPLAHKDEIGQLARSFDEMAEAVEQMVNNQRQLLSDISHELRTPLTRLQLASAISRRKQGDSLEQDRIDKEAQLLETMLQQLLTLCRFRKAESQEFQSLPLGELLDEVLNNAVFEAEENHKQLIIDIDEELRLNAIGVLLARAVENIVRNAIRYARQQVFLTSRVEQRELQLIIRDDGPGVPEADLGKLITPFYRVSDARDRESGGTGLGLAIANTAVLRHNGRLAIRNRPQGGLEVAIVLPLPTA